MRNWERQQYKVEESFNVATSSNGSIELAFFAKIAISSRLYICGVQFKNYHTHNIMLLKTFADLFQKFRAEFNSEIKLNSIEIFSLTSI